MTTFEDRIKAQLGELLFSSMHLAAELERSMTQGVALQAELEELKAAAAAAAAEDAGAPGDAERSGVAGS